ncbi:hypothetical protein DERF_002437 [Dermatophagoides farinae]|uniref:Uncharacterized protein n=2 Tax=Dermatophagoides farinae TaxID=6954 RepID=A0A922IFP2_DERFA|nr:hypothetical protein DERF_002437 [Dermatophagoides farinae]
MINVARTKSKKNKQTNKMLFRNKISLAFLAIVALQMILIQDQMTAVSARKKWLQKLLFLTTLLNKKTKIIPLPLPLPIPIPLRIQKKDHVEVVEKSPTYVHQTYEDVYPEPYHGDYDGYGDSYAAASSNGDDAVSQVAPESSYDDNDESSTRVKTVYRSSSSSSSSPKSVRRIRYSNRS